MDQTCGVGKRTHRAITGQNFRPWRSEITDIQHIQYRAPTKRKKGVLSFLKNCISLV